MAVTNIWKLKFLGLQHMKCDADYCRQFQEYPKTQANAHRKLRPGGDNTPDFIVHWIPLKASVTSGVLTSLAQLKLRQLSLISNIRPSQGPDERTDKDKSMLSFSLTVTTLWNSECPFYTETCTHHVTFVQPRNICSQSSKWINSTPSILPGTFSKQISIALFHANQWLMMRLYLEYDKCNHILYTKSTSPA